MNRPLDTCMEQLRQDVFAFTPVLVDYRFQVLGRTLARWYTCFSHLVWSPLDGFVANEPSLRNRAFFLSAPDHTGTTSTDILGHYQICLSINLTEIRSSGLILGTIVRMEPLPNSFRLLPTGDILHVGPAD